MNRGEETAVSMSLFFAMTYFPHLSSIFAFFVFLQFKNNKLSQRRNISILFCVKVSKFLTTVWAISFCDLDAIYKSIRGSISAF